MPSDKALAAARKAKRLANARADKAEAALKAAIANTFDIVSQDYLRSRKGGDKCQ